MTLQQTAVAPSPAHQAGLGGLIDRRVYPVIPPRVEYALTPLGRSLLEAVRGLIAWSEANTQAIQDDRQRYDATVESMDDALAGTG